MTEAVARAALAAAARAAEPLEPRHGWANEAWIGESVVVRLSSGRLRGSLRHEARVLAQLPDVSIPVATPIAHGRIKDLDADVDVDADADAAAADDSEAAEWLISHRVAGETLAAVWPDLDATARRGVGAQIASVLRALHAVSYDGPDPEWWVEAQHDPAVLHNCYHPPPALGPQLVDAASDLVGADLSLLGEVGSLISERTGLFDDDVIVLAHCDVHAHNVLVDPSSGQLAAILDWEGAHRASPDVELDMFLRYVCAAHAFPERPNAPVRIVEGDMVELIDHVRAGYPELFAGPHLLERLEVYDAHWHLIQILTNARLHGESSSRDPAWDRLRLLLDQKSHLHVLSL